MDATVPHAERGRRVAPLADLTAIVFDDARLLAFGRLAAIFLVPLTLALVVLLFGTGPVPRRNWYGEILGNDFTQVWVVAAPPWKAAPQSRTTSPATSRI